MLSSQTALDIMLWHTGNGGSFRRPAGHALKILEEAIELCYACGASVNEVAYVVHSETDKAVRKREVTNHPHFLKAKEEIADVTILTHILATHLNTSMDVEAKKKLPILRRRAWKATGDGVLKRSDRV